MPNYNPTQNIEHSESRRANGTETHRRPPSFSDIHLRSIWQNIRLRNIHSLEELGRPLCASLNRHIREPWVDIRHLKYPHQTNFTEYINTYPIINRCQHPVVEITPRIRRSNSDCLGEVHRVEHAPGVLDIRNEYIRTPVGNGPLGVCGDGTLAQEIAITSRKGTTQIRNCTLNGEGTHLSMNSFPTVMPLM